MKNKNKYQLKGYINTPPLWLGKNLFNLYQFKLPHSNIPRDLDLTSAIPSLASNFVMGKRAESFFKLVIDHSNSYKVIAMNLQIQKAKITTGELDFLLEDIFLNRQLHVEVVYKFYLFDPAFELEMEGWIGPNRKDTLLNKIDKLKKHQLPLIFKPESMEVLKNYNLQPEELQQQICFKANLFVPRNFKTNKLPKINLDCIAGYWIPFSDFSKEEFGNFLFFAPIQQDWPCDPEFNEEWINFSEINSQILELFGRGRSPLIWMKKSEIDYQRFFVVWWQEKRGREAE